MSWKQIGLFTAAAGAGVALVASVDRQGPSTLVLSGLVTTEEVVVAPLVSGRLLQLHVREGSKVTRGQLLAELEPGELEADRAYFARSAQASAAQASEGGAALRLQQREAAARIRQAAANVAATEGEREAAGALLEDARAASGRLERLAQAGTATEQDRDHSRRAFEAAEARVASLGHQIEAQRAALDLARAGAEQTSLRRAALSAAREQQGAAEAQQAKAEQRLGYARLLSPIDGVVDVRAARSGEYVAAGQPVLALVDPDDLWIRADVEESYIDRVRLGDKLRVRLASGDEREGTVFLRGVDAGFATQRDVSRTKRDLRTFELRLRVGNQDRRLALGATASVVLPLAPLPPVAR